MRRGLFLALLVLSACRASLPNPKLIQLERILAARDDNDPRLDSDFEELSEATKRAFRKRYNELARESFNERGTIVYLLGRNMTTVSDWEFFHAVVAEPPCLSLSNCTKAEGTHGDEVTLAYPALVALKRAQREAEGGRNKEAARRVVAEALRSESPAVRRLAERNPGR